MTKISKTANKVPEGDSRFSANIKKELHMRFKLHSVKTGKSMGEILEEWIAKNTPEV